MNADAVRKKILLLKAQLAELDASPTTITSIDEGIRLRKEIDATRATYARSLGGNTFFIPW